MQRARMIHGHRSFRGQVLIERTLNRNPHWCRAHSTGCMSWYLVVFAAGRHIGHMGSGRRDGVWLLTIVQTWSRTCTHMPSYCSNEPPNGGEWISHRQLAMCSQERHISCTQASTREIAVPAYSAHGYNFVTDFPRQEWGQWNGL